MGFRRHGQLAESNLTDLDGDLVALKYLGEAENITYDLPDEGTVTSKHARARLFTFKPDGTSSQYLGETLVFPQIIARELRSDPDNWHLGVLKKRTQSRDKSRTVFTLEAPESDPDRVFAAMEEELTARGQS